MGCRYVASHVVPRSSLQLVGVTCLQIASKYGEVGMLWCTGLGLGLGWPHGGQLA